jgi:hypothetical protein
MSFSDNEIPVGTVNGVNVTFTLNNAPNPASSLQLYKNGLLLKATVDYTLSSLTITYAVAPANGAVHVAWYRF